jgi:hypothetical protein
MKLKSPESVKRDANMMRVTYYFKGEDLEEVMKYRSLDPELELAIITDLIQLNTEEWKEMEFEDRMDWISDEVINETVIWYLMQECVSEILIKENLDVEDADDIIVDRSYEGDALVVSLSVILGSPNAEDNRIVSIFKNV